MSWLVRNLFKSKVLIYILIKNWITRIKLFKKVSYLNQNCLKVGYPDKNCFKRLSYQPQVLPKTLPFLLLESVFGSKHDKYDRAKSLCTRNWSWFASWTAPGDHVSARSHWSWPENPTMLTKFGHHYQAGADRSAQESRVEAESRMRCWTSWKKEN